MKNQLSLMKINSFIGLFVPGLSPGLGKVLQGQMVDTSQEPMLGRDRG